MVDYIVERMEVNRHILDDDRYAPIFSVEKVNRLAASGVPFRDAYKQVGLEIEAGKFTTDKQVHHTHEAASATSVPRRLPCRCRPQSTSSISNKSNKPKKPCCVPANEPDLHDCCLDKVSKTSNESLQNARFQPQGRVETQRRYSGAIC